MTRLSPNAYRRAVALSWLVICALLSATAVPAATNPGIFWVSDPAGPGDSVIIVGDNLGNSPVVELQELKNDPAAKPTDLWQHSRVVQAIQAGDQSMKVIIPSEFGSGVYAMRIRNGQASAQWLVNAPTLYWVQGDQGTSASPGGWIRVFGRSVGHDGASAALELTSADGENRISLKSVKASLWESRFILPADLKPGQYDVRLHSGWGDASAWVSVGRFGVKHAEQWPDKRFNVREFGAAGNGIVNDTKAVLAALDAAAANGGGIVYFPRGRYLISEPLRIPKYVILQGERRDLVSLFWDETDRPPDIMISGANHFALEDLTLYASNHQHFIAGDVETTQAGPPGHVRLHRITVRISMYRGHLKPEEVDQRYRASLKYSGVAVDLVRLGGENIVITDSSFYGSGRSLYLFKPRGAYVARNSFFNGRLGWYCLTGADGLIFEDNEVIGADLMATGGSLNALGDTAYSQNVFFARNKISLLYGWDREALTSDAGYGYYYGTVKNSTDRSVTLAGGLGERSGSRSSWIGAGVFILGGKGMGQFAQVERIAGTAVFLDRPWQVSPDASSVITITMMQQNYLVIDNEFTDAGVAIQFYGTSVNHIAAGNRSTRTAGFYNSGRWYRHYQPSWYCQFLGNEILEGNVYRGGANNAMVSGEAVIGTYGFQKPPNAVPLTLGTVLRRNHLHSNAHIEVRGISKDARGVRDVIVEGNTVEHATIGLLVDEGSLGVLERKNVFIDVSVPVQAPMQIRPVP